MGGKSKLDRLPPWSEEAERGVLACCLIDPQNAIGDTIEALGEEAFYDGRHRLLWTTLRRLYDEKKGVDQIMVEAALGSEALEQLGGGVWLSELQNATPSAINLPYYLTIVKEKWLLRRMIQACVENVEEIYGGAAGNGSELPVDDCLAKCEQRVIAASEKRVASSERSMRDVVLDVTDNVLDKFVRGRKFSIGPNTGFNYLDNILPGLGAGQLIVVAARPRTGKSAFMMQVAEWMAIVTKTPVAIFSLEMTARSLGLREIFQKAGCDLTKFLNGFMSEVDVRALTNAGLSLAAAPIWIDESPRMAIEDLEVRLRRMVRQREVKCCFVDYFQLLYMRNARNNWNTNDELSRISMRLKALAKELSIPIVLLAQMNRQIEQDTNRRPRLSDLRDTGQLEQDADVVMFLWKPEVRLDEPHRHARFFDMLSRVPCPEEWKTEQKNKEGKTWKHYLTVVTCTVEKQREGRSGEDASLVFIRPWVRFVDSYRPRKQKHEEGTHEVHEVQEAPAEVAHEAVEMGSEGGSVGGNGAGSGGGAPGGAPSQGRHMKLWEELI